VKLIHACAPTDPSCRPIDQELSSLTLCCDGSKAIGVRSYSGTAIQLCHFGNQNCVAKDVLRDLMVDCTGELAQSRRWSDQGWQAEWEKT
jgi:hypothetical protein